MIRRQILKSLILAPFVGVKRSSLERLSLDDEFIYGIILQIIHFDKAGKEYVDINVNPAGYKLLKSLEVFEECRTKEMEYRCPNKEIKIKARASVNGLIADIPIPIGAAIGYTRIK